MKIIVIGSGGDYKDGGNAASIHTREVANNLSHFSNVEVYYVSSSKIRDHHIVKKITVFPYFRNFLLRFFYYYLILPVCFFCRFLFSKNTVVYCRFGALSFAALVGAKFSGRKIFFEVNGLKADEMLLDKRKKLINFLKLPFLSLLEWVVFYFSDGLVVVTEGLKDVIVNKYKIDRDRVAVIPNGVNPEIYKPIPDAKKKTRAIPQSALHLFCGKSCALAGR